MRYGRFTTIASAAVIFTLALVGCGKKERFPQAGEPAFEYQLPANWPVTSFQNRGANTRTFMSPTKCTVVTMAVATDPAVGLISYRTMADSFLKTAKGFQKAGGFEDEQVGDLKGKSCKFTRVMTDGVVETKLMLFRVDDQHFAFFATALGSNAPGDEKKVAEDFLRTLKIVHTGAQPSPAPDEQMLELREDALAAMEGKNFDRAIQLWSEVLKRNPGNVEAYFQRSHAYWAEDKLDKSLDDINATLRLDPGMNPAYLIRGAMYLQNGERERGIADMDRYLKSDPTNAQALGRRGSAYLQLHQYDKALADFNASIKADPKLEPAYSERGRAYQEMGEYEKAATDFETAMRLMPGNPSLLNKVAWLYATCPKDPVRNGAKAVELAMKACELTQWGNSWYADTLAAAYAEAGKWEEAMNYEKLALQLEKAGKNDAETVKGYEERLELYGKKQAYRSKRE